MLDFKRGVVYAVLGAALVFTHTATAFPRTSVDSFQAFKRQAGQNATNPLRVDLGYEIYEGVANSTTGLNTFKGIRYAAPPIGSLRWQPPHVPTYNRSSTISAASLAPACPQNPDSFSQTSGKQSPFVLGTEDCLFLSVYSPSNASNLPVLVWIHGGGYGEGSGSQDLSAIINANSNGFVGVAIQYRLGAFGFLSSDEVFRNGVVNAGILDQHFALQWVQSYISLFGGNASQVTISGESAGGGSVMLQTMAYGGTLGTSLFTNSIAASPYLPMQYGYRDWIPSQSYYAFAIASGCPPVTAYGSSAQTVFECLTSKDTETLQRASFNISSSGTYGTWGFLPVTDGVFIQQLPSTQLQSKKVNGLNILSGNNAEEGAPFTTPNITTEADLVAWLTLTFPLFSPDDIDKILLYYPSTDASDISGMLEYATSGIANATAVNVSQVAAGQQQRADNIYAETTFVCPSYWLATAFTPSRDSPSAKSWKYQYSVPNAYHGADVSSYFGPAPPNQGPDLLAAVQHIWGAFITTNDPSIPASIANSTDASVAEGETVFNGTWPPFSTKSPWLLNMNQTGGEAFSTNVGIPNMENVTEYRGPGLKNAFSLANGYTWEGGRGVRCDFWRAMGEIVPE
ncbi:carboxylesterase type B [Mytilinidion resinicola]|uniref:Carboxylic ester hydrolase n=1 Tax=Mytilinidion resinicola TaxID=574789 RepID=A0A6A6YZB1_9PEZI|nr:carboxylesterase type B [Mytilinidion resinicola]KAF2814090.1 carboxylesterase type B [Mytilinidion resinicola]